MVMRRSSLSVSAVGARSLFFEVPATQRNGSCRAGLAWRQMGADPAFGEGDEVLLGREAGIAGDLARLGAEPGTVASSSGIRA
jgi:hypothetical protein